MIILLHLLEDYYSCLGNWCPLDTGQMMVRGRDAEDLSRDPNKCDEGINDVLFGYRFGW